jgi:diguanylate cyclase (GGDEF)-like protein
LTGLPNQLRFEERTSAALAQLRSPGDILAVLCIDIDRFKRVNDGLGHPAGNELLRQVAARLSAAVGPGDTVARMGGDEFTILLTGVRSTNDALLVAEQILRWFVEPFMLEGQGVHLTPSIGIAVAPGAGLRASALLKNADTATHRAKERGRNCYQLYSTEMNVEASDRLALEGDLHEALDAGQLRVVYQPQVDLATGRTVGVEALARWPHPVRGMIGPDTFIPLAEETGLITALDDWMLRTACAQGRVWAEAGLPSLRIAVNLSGQAFHRTNVVARVAETLARTGLPAAQLELEVTESMAIDQVVDVRPTFRDLEALGVKLAIDDFGTGYSALSRLQGFPFHSLKIDRSFVANIDKPDDSAPIVAAMIAMAHALGLDVIAEGVETQAQQAFLEGHRCDMAQGYRFSRPIDPDDIGAFLVRHRGLVPVR